MHSPDLQDEFFDTPRLSTVQALVLMLKYQEGIRRPGFFYRSWVHFGTITRMVQDPGLNRSFDKYSYPISNEDMIARKRVWQVCFLCDQFMSGAQGMHYAITAGLPKRIIYTTLYKKELTYLTINLSM